MPKLLRTSLQDWSVGGVRVHLGSGFLSAGRELTSISRSDVQQFYGFDVHFGSHPGSSWMWYCGSSEWFLLIVIIVIVIVILILILVMVIDILIVIVIVIV